MELMKAIDFDVKFKSDKYKYEGNIIPRVSDILSSMDNMEFIPKWANYLGFKRLSYEKELAYSADIGTYVHNFNELYVKGISYDMNEVPVNMKEKVTNAHNAFLNWFNIISKNDINIIGTETELLCQWFGGTCDLIISINGKTYIVDYKTSNNVSYKYFLQMAAYKYIFELNGYKIDGCIILQLNKNEPVFTEYILNFENEQHLNYINQCTITFESMLYGYYNKLYCMQQYSNIF